jgi:8-oxo-dGTP diphosphatase
MRSMREKPNPKIVAIAVIEKDGQILIGRRKRGKHHAGLWEFPGGTVENGETHEECLLRELREEFDADARIVRFIGSCDHTYAPDWSVRLAAYLAEIASDDLKLNDHDEIRWVSPDELGHYLANGASRSIIEILFGTTG